MGSVSWHTSAIVLALAVVACCADEDESLPALEDVAVPLVGPGEDTIVSTDLFASVSECDVYHRGVLLDLGSRAMGGRYGYGIFPGGESRDVIADGATWARVDSRMLSIQFFQPEEQKVFVQARMRGLGSSRATVRLDGKAIEGIRFGRESIDIVTTSITEEPLSEGNHVVSFQFYGGKRDEPKAEIDWVRVGVPDNDPTTFAAPTVRDLAVSATVGGRPHRAIALRGPGRVRCAFAALDGMRLQTTIGYAGPGQGESRIHLIEPGKPPYLLHATKLGGEGKEAESVDLPLEGHAGRIVAVELVAEKTTPGGRILFGDPTLRIRAPGVPSRSAAKVVIVLVFTGADVDQLPPYQQQPTMPNLTTLAEQAVAFLNHRAPTSVSAGSMASLLTGLSPASHKVSDTGARLSTRFPTIGTIARDGRVATSMFTGNPTTFEAFGFAHGWDRYGEFTPVSGTSARAPLREAAAWVEERLEKEADRPLMVVIHARGGHPPWAVTAEQTKDLPPKEYAGDVNSRRGGQFLATERFRKGGHPRINAEDRVRIAAFAKLALEEEDALLGNLIALLREQEIWDSTMLIITSDVAMGGGSRIPFGDGEELGEDVLHLPLIVRFPGQRFGGSRVNVPTNATDIAKTVLAALRLDPPDTMAGRDLLEVAAHPGRFGTVPQFALREAQYSTRWGDWLLTGTSPKGPQFCTPGAATTCAIDESWQSPFFASWMWRMTYARIRDDESLLPVPSREPATLDPDTVAALMVWGNLEPKSGK